MRKRPIAWAALLMFLLLQLIPAVSLYREPQITEKCKGQVTGRVIRRTRKKEQLQLDLADCLIQNDTNTIEASHILVYLTDEAEYPVGADLSLSGIIYPIETSTNPGQFDSRLYYEGQGVDCTVYAEKAQILKVHSAPIREGLTCLRERMEHVYEKTFDEQESGMMKAMILGQKGSLDKEMKELYQRNGIAHLLAISGLHISLVGMGLYRILRRLTGNAWVSGIPVVLLTIAYGWMSGASLSAFRAVFMCGLMITAELIGRTYDLLTALGASALVFLLTMPLNSHQSTFWLSFGAVLAIGVLTPIWKLYFPKQGKLLSSVSVSLSVTAVTFPALLTSFYEYPLYATFLNLLVIPLMSILMVCGLLCGVTGLLWLPGAGLFALPCQWILMLYEWAGNICLNLPAAVLRTGSPAAWKLRVYYFVLAAGVFFLYREKQKKKYSKRPDQYIPNRRKAMLCSGSLFLAAILLCVRIHTGLEIAMLDVGQGDGIFFRSPNGTTFLSDGGSTNVSAVGTYRLLPFLKFEGEGTIDYLLISHMDQDHINGVAELLKDSQKPGGISIRNAVLPDVGQKDEAYVDMEQALQEAGVEILYMGKGDVLKSDTLLLTCLWPESNLTSDDRNEQSLVLLAEYGKFQMLLTGDIGAQTEKELAASGMLRQVELLKVAHHGSRHSSTEAFLSQVQPELSFISCSSTNRYGHPGEETLERLKQTGSRILITKDRGAIGVCTDGKKVWVKTWK